MHLGLKGAGIYLLPAALHPSLGWDLGKSSLPFPRTCHPKSQHTDKVPGSVNLCSWTCNVPGSKLTEMLTPTILAIYWVTCYTASPGQGWLPSCPPPTLPAHTPGRHQCIMGFSNSAIQLPAYSKSINSHGYRKRAGRAWDPRPAGEGVARASVS